MPPYSPKLLCIEIETVNRVIKQDFSQKRLNDIILNQNHKEPELAMKVIDDLKQIVIKRICQLGIKLWDNVSYFDAMNDVELKAKS